MVDPVTQLWVDQGLAQEAAGACGGWGGVRGVRDPRNDWAGWCSGLAFAQQAGQPPPVDAPHRAGLAPAVLCRAAPETQASELPGRLPLSHPEPTS